MKRKKLFIFTVIFIGTAILGVYFYFSTCRDLQNAIRLKQLGQDARIYSVDISDKNVDIDIKIRGDFEETTNSVAHIITDYLENHPNHWLNNCNVKLRFVSGPYVINLFNYNPKNNTAYDKPTDFKFMTYSVQNDSEIRDLLKFDYAKNISDFQLFPYDVTDYGYDKKLTDIFQNLKTIHISKWDSELEDKFKNLFEDREIEIIWEEYREII
jgi:hypothetical protein